MSGSVDTGVPGTCALSYGVSDGYNTTTVTRTVHVVDTTEPTISAPSASPSVALAAQPQGRQRDGGLLGVGRGRPSPFCALGVARDGPVNGTGDGDTSPDWQVLDAHHLKLRAERAGEGDGRVIRSP